MSHRFFVLFFLFCCCFAAAAFAQQTSSDQPMMTNMSEAKFANLPGLPTCATGAVQSGDPSSGPSVILAKATAGCIFPWHWHTPTEQVMMVSGTAHLTPKDGKKTTLKAGAFASLPSHHIHLFHCATQCVLFVHSDGAFDMHYVDEQGNEITAEDALKAVHETAAKAPSK